MVSIYEMRQKEVINVNDGLRYGYICDLEINIKTGKIIAIIVPGPGKVFGLFGRDQEYKILWCDILQIGEDIILVDVDTRDCLKEC